MPLVFNIPLTPLTDLERAVRDLLGRAYDHDHGDPPERFNPHRALTVTAIPGGFELASHVALALRGTPARGLIILAVSHAPHVAFDTITGRQLSDADAAVLLRFVTAASGTPADRIPRHFRWTSRDDVRDSPPRSKRRKSTKP